MSRNQTERSDAGFIRAPAEHSLLCKMEVRPPAAAPTGAFVRKARRAFSKPHLPLRMSSQRLRFQPRATAPWVRATVKRAPALAE